MVADKWMMWFVPFLIPVAIDTFSCGLGVRRAWQGSGPSGLPVVTIPLYGLIGYAVTDQSLGGATAALVAGAVVHGLLVFAIPMWVERTKTGF